jgi:hypothetical protein
MCDEIRGGMSTNEILIIDGIVRHWDDITEDNKMNLAKNWKSSFSKLNISIYKQMVQSINKITMDHSYKVKYSISNDKKRFKKNSVIICIKSSR